MIRIARNGNEIKHLSDRGALMEAVAMGLVKPSDHFYEEGMDEWQEVRSIPDAELIYQPPEPPPPQRYFHASAEPIGGAVVENRRIPPLLLVALCAFGTMVAVSQFGKLLNSDSFDRSSAHGDRDDGSLVTQSAWDGSVRQVKRYLEDNLKDPGSLEVIEWSPISRRAGAGYSVRCRYRARNSFGGYVVENKIFLMDHTGQVTGTIGY